MSSRITHAYMGDQILQRAKLVEIPVEQPTKFELVASLKAAKEIEPRIPFFELFRNL
jgi:hypothetical protein